jgi:hypothetical protein
MGDDFSGSIVFLSLAAASIGQFRTFRPSQVAMGSVSGVDWNYFLYMSRIAAAKGDLFFYMADNL